MGSIPELELMGNSGIAYLKQNGIGNDKFEIKVSFKNNFSMTILIGILTIWNRYSEYLLVVKKSR